MFFQTILSNSSFKNDLISSAIHYTDWWEKKSNPAILRRDQVSAAIASGAWFARKFEDIDALDHVDQLRRKTTFF